MLRRGARELASWRSLPPVIDDIPRQLWVNVSASQLLEADFGGNYNVATLGHILHSEGVERSRALLAKTFKALAPGGTIAIAEFLVNRDRSGPANALLFAVNMLVNTENGSTYSFEEISSWLGEAGFTNARSLDAPGPSPLILATKAPGVS